MLVWQYMFENFPKNIMLKNLGGSYIGGALLLEIIRYESRLHNLTNKIRSTPWNIIILDLSTYLTAN